MDARSCYGQLQDTDTTTGRWMAPDVFQQRYMQDVLWSRGRADREQKTLGACSRVTITVTCVADGEHRLVTAFLGDIVVMEWGVRLVWLWDDRYARAGFLVWIAVDEFGGPR